MKNEYYFKNVSEIGNLALDHVFFEFGNEPILFTLIDDQYRTYLCLSTQTMHEQTWLISSCKTETLKGLIHERIDVASALFGSSRISLVIMNIDGIESSKTMYTEEVKNMGFIDDGIMIRCDAEEAYKYIAKRELQDTLCEAKKNKVHMTRTRSHNITTNVVANLETCVANFSYEPHIEKEMIPIHEKAHIHFSKTNTMGETHFEKDVYGEKSSLLFKVMKNTHNYSAA